MKKAQTLMRDAAHQAAAELGHIRNGKAVFGTLAVVYLLAVSAVLRADVDYMDDVVRNMWGYRDFGFNRLLSDFLSIFVHTGKYITDISPLTQILAVLIVSAASYVVLAVFCRKETVGIWEIAAVLPLGMSPYFMECLSYKFDAPYMALSVLVSVVPLLFLSAHGAVYILVTALAAIAVSTTYQAASGIFPVAVVFLTLKKWRGGRTCPRSLPLWSIPS